MVPETQAPKTVPKRVLVVDDERENVELLARILRRTYDVHPFTDPRSARRAITDGRPFEVLVTDIMMPMLTGLTLAKHVRTAQPSIVIVAVSAYTDTRDVLAAYREGIFDLVVQKPCQPADVRSAVERAVLIGEMRALDGPK